MCSETRLGLGATHVASFSIAAAISCSCVGSDVISSDDDFGYGGGDTDTDSDSDSDTDTDTDTDTDSDTDSDADSDSDTDTDSDTGTGSPCTPAEVVADGSFEIGTPSTAWEESSTNFGTPICDNPTCAPDNPDFGSRTGTFWAWFGGFAGFEEGSLSQNVSLGNGPASLRFFLWISAASGEATDSIVVSVDGSTVFTAARDDVAYQLEYAQVDVDLSAWGDGGTHELRLYSSTFGSALGVTNFFVDDVSVMACP